MKSDGGKSPKMIIHSSLGEKMKENCTFVAVPDLHCDEKTAKCSFYSWCAGSLGSELWGGCVLFTVPSQKSTLMTITVQLLWLGGPSLACLTLLRSDSSRKPRPLHTIHTRLTESHADPVHVFEPLQTVFINAGGLIHSHEAGCPAANSYWKDSTARDFMILWSTEVSPVDWLTCAGL